MKVKVSRFELYPKENPIGYCVGFTVTAKNNRQLYRDVIVNFTENENRTEPDIIVESWKLIGKEIQQIVDEIEGIPELLGEDIVEKIPEWVRSDELSIDQIKEMLSFFPKYEVGVSYLLGDLFSHEGELYEVLQDHTSQQDWVPSSTPSLYVSKTLPNVISNWVQPQGAHDSYSQGDRVLHLDKIWESELNDNVWEPSVYGWIEVNEN